MQLSCAFTGHRPSKFRWGYDEEHPDCAHLKLLLLQQIAGLADNGVTVFYSGMAQGVDQWAAQAVLALKSRYKGLLLNCILPCETQADKWSAESRERYFDILAEADETHYISRRYTDDCMRQRNRYMVDHAGFVLAVYNGERHGGTAETVRYAKQRKRAVIIINSDTFEVTPFTVLYPAKPNENSVIPDGKGSPPTKV